MRFKKIFVYLLLYLLTFAIILSVVFLSPKQAMQLNVIRVVIIFFATVLLIKYFIYMLVSPWYDVVNAYRLNKYRATLKKHIYNPRVSVIIPTWNEGNGVITTIQALLKSSYKNMELIVVDNGSTDGTKARVAEIIKDNIQLLNLHKGIDVLYAKENKQGKGYALNTGILLSQGEIIISIDADCYVPPDTIQNFVNRFRDPRVMAAVGNVKIGNTQTLVGVVQYLEFLFSFYFKKSDSLFGCIYIIGGAAGAFRKEVFQKLGGYSVSNITEDIDLSIRIQYAGMKIDYVEDAVVYTEGASDIKGLIMQRLRWKRGRFETFLNYRDLFFSHDKKHNKILSWGILPLALFGDLQLFLELFFVVFVYAYSYLTDDYSSFISGIIVVGSMFIVQILFDTHRKKSARLLLLAPIGWLLLYVSTFVEFIALIKTLIGYLKKEKVGWQTWKRTGVFLNAAEVIKTTFDDKR